MIHLVRIKTLGNGRFEINAEGESARVAPVRSFEIEMIGVSEGVPIDGEVYEIVDYVAWMPDRTGTWWLLYGDETPILGARALRIAAYYHDAIRLYETPEAWLLGGQRGVCVLLWTAPLNDLFVGIGLVE